MSVHYSKLNEHKIKFGLSEIASTIKLKHFALIEKNIRSQICFTHITDVPNLGTSIYRSCNNNKRDHFVFTIESLLRNE